jgi:hypothetical protein
LYGYKLASIKDPVKTILVAENPAFYPFSWHEPRRIPQGLSGANNAKNLASFADGHVRYTRMYSDENYFVATCFYDPPADYEYRWSPE